MEPHQVIKLINYQIAKVILDEPDWMRCGEHGVGFVGDDCPLCKVRIEKERLDVIAKAFQEQVDEELKRDRLAGGKSLRARTATGRIFPVSMPGVIIHDEIIFDEVFIPPDTDRLTSPWRPDGSTTPRQQRRQRTNPSSKAGMIRTICPRCTQQVMFQPGDPNPICISCGNMTF